MADKPSSPPRPSSLAELFASWGPNHLIDPNEPRAFTKLAARYADLLQLVHLLEKPQSESGRTPEILWKRMIESSVGWEGNERCEATTISKKAFFDAFGK